MEWNSLLVLNGVRSEVWGLESIDLQSKEYWRLRFIRNVVDLC